MKTLAERIRELRSEQDLSLRELARYLDVSSAFLSDVELGRRYPSEELLSRIAKKLHTSLADLRAYDNRPPIDELRRRASANPQFALALRRIIDRNVSSEELLKLTDLDRSMTERKKPR